MVIPCDPRGAGFLHILVGNDRLPIRTRTIAGCGRSAANSQHSKYSGQCSDRSQVEKTHDSKLHSTRDVTRCVSHETPSPSKRSRRRILPKKFGGSEIRPRTDASAQQLSRRAAEAISRRLPGPPSAVGASLGPLQRADAAAYANRPRLAPSANGVLSRCLPKILADCREDFRTRYVYLLSACGLSRVRKPVVSDPNQRGIQLWLREKHP